MSGVARILEVGIMVKKPNKRVDGHEAGHVASTELFNWHDFDPAMLNGKDDFSVKLTTYRDKLDTLLNNRGEYVVIKGSEVIGTHPTQDEAMETAFRFAPGPSSSRRLSRRSRPAKSACRALMT